MALPQPASAAEGRFALLGLSLSEFRCYRELRLETDERPVVLTGPNGAGKTNLLEALSFLAPGRGLRRANLAEVTRRRASGDWAVSGTAAAFGNPIQVGTGADGNRRVVRVDGTPARSQSVLGEILSVVWLTPEMDGLFAVGASARRLFLDRLVASFDAAHFVRLNAYERAMRERNGLLREERAGRRSADSSWLAALERRMTESGIALAAARRDFVRRLAAACAPGTGHFPAAGVSLSDEDWLDGGSALQAEDRLRDALADSRDMDRQAGRALIGPHRADLEVVHLQKGQPAVACSTGEQKALLIGIVLAHARLVALDRGAAPILLLDEIAAHLDAERRAGLFDEICALGAQAWMTGSDLPLFGALGDRAQYFRVENAAVLGPGG